VIYKVIYTHTEILLIASTVHQNVQLYYIVHFIGPEAQLDNLCLFVWSGMLA